MKTILSMIALGLALSMGAAQAQEKKANPQHERMAACNKEAGDKKGDERKAFMSKCLKDKQMAQQEKMKACNKDAGEKKLKGDDRKKFMSSCLSNKA